MYFRFFPYCSNGCKIPIKKALFVAGPILENNTVESEGNVCLLQVQNRVLEPFEKCISRDIPGGPFSRLGNVLNNAVKAGGLPKNP